MGGADELITIISKSLYLSSTNSWAGNETDGTHCAIPVSKGEKITITPNTTKNLSYYAWVTTDDGISSGDSIAFVSRYEARYTVREKTTIEAPVDCILVVNLLMVSNEDYSPSSMMKKNDGLTEKVSALESKVQTDEEQITKNKEEIKTANDDITEIKENVTGGTSTVTPEEKTNYVSYSSKTWVEGSGSHGIISVNTGDIINIVAQSAKAAYWAWVENDEVGTDNAVNYVDGYTITKVDANTSSGELTAPKDCYLLVNLKIGSSDYSPSSITKTTNGITNRIENLESKSITDEEQIATNVTDILVINKKIDGGEESISVSSKDNFVSGTTTLWVTTAGSHAIIQVKEGDTISILPNAEKAISYYAWVVNDEVGTDNAVNYVEGYSIEKLKSDSSVEVVAPCDCYLLINLLMANNADYSPASVTRIYESINAIFKKSSDSITLLEERVTKCEGNGIARAKWLAMGDSITWGWYSAYDGEGGKGTGHKNREIGYASKVAKINDYTLTNVGVGGQGWNDAAGDTDVHGARTLVDSLDVTGYDLITIAYGINDYKGNTPLGSMDDDYSTTYSVVANMRYIIEKILTDNPTVKIIIITPLNARGYTGQELGDESSNYAIGHTHKGSAQGDGFTLAQMVDAEIEVCKYYGILYIDMTYQSCINRKNMITTLPDGVHPSADAHTILARELSKNITCW